MVAFALAVGCSDGVSNPTHSLSRLRLAVPDDTVACCDARHAQLVYDGTDDTVPTLNARWSVSDSAVLQVDGAGFYTVRANLKSVSRVDLIASVGGVTLRRSILVTPIITTVVMPPTASLRGIGTVDTVVVHVTGPGLTSFADSFVTWTSSDTAVIAVAASGILTARSAGVATVKGAVGRSADSLIMRVIPSYAVTEIPQADSATFISRFNARGDVLFWQAPAYRLWTGGTPRSLDDCSSAFDLNSRGEVLCGLAGGAIGVWAAGQIRTLTNPPVTGLACSRVRFNGSGVVAFIQLTETSLGCLTDGARGGIWRPGSTTTPVDLPAGASDVVYFDDQENIGVAGSSGAWLLKHGAGRWDGFQQTIANPSYYPSYYFATAMNAAGYIVGGFHARWATDVGMLRKPGEDPARDNVGVINGINSSNTVIGHWNDLNTGFLGAADNYYTARIRDLTTDLRYTFFDPLAINDAGMIVVKAKRRADGQTLLVRLAVTATP